MKSLIVILAYLGLSSCGLAHDKVLHMGAGALTYGPQQLIAPPADNSTVFQRCAGSIAIGFGKEIYDSTGRGHVEVADFAATVLGCVVVDQAFQVWKAIRS
jgi:hypothetical protein